MANKSPFFYTRHTDHDPWSTVLRLCSFLRFLRPWVAERSEAIPITIAMVMLIVFFFDGSWCTDRGSWSLVRGLGSGGKDTLPPFRGPGIFVRGLCPPLFLVLSYIVTVQSLQQS